jgi:outer membrane protein assembly factor BamB
MSDTRLSRAGSILAVAILFASLASETHTTPSAGGGPLFAVIPTLGIGGPLAILALLFPSLFGGVLVLFRQWGAFFAVVSVNSLLFCFQWWFARSLENSWWGTPTALWLVMTFVTLWGAAWAWRRNVTALRTGNLPEAPARTEHLILWILSLSCVLAFGYFVLFKLHFDIMWALMLVLTAGLWAGTLYKAYRAIIANGSMAGDLPTEGVMLGTMLAGCIVFMSWQARPTASIAPAGAVTATLLEREDPYYGPDAVGFGMVLSSPTLAEGKVYVGLAETDPGGNREKGMGALFCLDQKTNKIVWTFNDMVTEEQTDAQNKKIKVKKSTMQPVFSSPCVSGDRVYIGEGFHYNPNCKLYCVNTKNGEKFWDFQTKSQVESTPCVANGAVFVGAGNDGVYALADAAERKELWHFPRKPEDLKTDKIVRFGASPVVANGKLFIGSGVDRENPDACDSALFCLDAATGDLLWKKNHENLPCWAAAVVSGDHVFFALGNGDIYEDGPNPAGAVLCLHAKTGDKIWRYPEKGFLPAGVHTRPALDGQSIYFGCRDGHIYCLDRKDGKLRWHSKDNMGSPIFSSPALDATDELNPKLFAVATGGRVSCLNPKTGDTLWTFSDLEQRDVLLASSPAVAPVSTPTGTQLKVYFGVYLKSSNRPYLYCLDDTLLSAAMKKSELK